VAARSSIPLCVLLLVSACGARTGLVVPDLGSSGQDAGIACVPGDIPLSLAQPEVMFVLDRSGSMSTVFSGTETRWQAVTTSLAATLPPVNGTMAVGALLFPSGASNDDCSVPSQPSLEPALGQVPALVSLMEGTSPGGATPTASAIETAASQLLDVRAATTARALVLATDGAPNCNPSLDPATCTCGSGTTGRGCRNNPNQCLDDVRTVARIASTYAQGVPTYVIGIADDDGNTFSDVLNAMALAGGRPLSGGATSYYPARSTADLETAVAAIRDQVGACTYLTTSVPDAAGSISITAGGETLPYDADGGASGWAWASEDNGQIILHGDACTEVSSDAGLPLVAHVTCGGDGGTEGGP
jgi:von Willebrand factor type A domain